MLDSYYLIWALLIIQFLCSPFYYAHWELWGLVPDVAGFGFTVLMARLLIRYEMKKLAQV